MQQTSISGRREELREIISNFLSERLMGKIEKLADDDPKRAEYQAQFVPATWLADAARRVAQIQAVTHSLKPIHPDAKGSSLYCRPADLRAMPLVGSHVLGEDFDVDVVGNAAALDVYKFLKLSHQGRSLLELCKVHDPDLALALGNDPQQALDWMTAFAGLSEPRGKTATHTRAKQVYWQIGADPHDDKSYHLLAPLYPTSLVHRVYQTLQDDRFSDAAKAARAARNARQMHDRPVREYRDLAVQQLGGTKPQNISQLNSERRGNNYLLASLPPVWRSASVRPLHGTDSMFKRFRTRPEVRRAVSEIRQFLGMDPAANQQTRRYRDALVRSLIDELLQFTAELRTLPHGWAADEACLLPAAHRAWLDPADEDDVPEDVADTIAADFAFWLNGQLREPLPMGDDQFLHWRKLMREELARESREGRHEP